LDIGWTFGDEMSRLGLEVVEGDGADNWWVDRFLGEITNHINSVLTQQHLCRKLPKSVNVR